MVFCKWKKNYSSCNKQEKLGSAEFGFADCVFRQIYFQRGFWGKAILLKWWGWGFSPLVFLRKKKRGKTWVILLFVCLFSLKLCTSNRKSGMLVVFLDCVSP